MHTLRCPGWWLPPPPRSRYLTFWRTNMNTLRSVKGRVNPRPPRREVRPRPLRGFTAAERRAEFRLHGPWYDFDAYRGPIVREWDGTEHRIAFVGDPEQCHAYLGFRHAS